MARDARRGTAEMTIEAKHPDDPHNESLDLPVKSGRTTQGGIVPGGNAKPGVKAVPAPVHPGQFNSGSTGVTKT